MNGASRRTLNAHRTLGAALLALCATTTVVLAAPRNTGKAWEDLTQKREVGLPTLAVVSLRQQRITVYDAQGKVYQAPVSTGRSGYETPVGVYGILEKKAEHFSNIYDDAPMPFMQRLTWSGIALHQGALPGYPASHGCVRLPHGFAERLFGYTRRGMRVVVARDDVAPVDIEHPKLLQPAEFTAGQPLSADRTSTASPNIVNVAISATVASAEPTRLAMSRVQAVAAEMAAAADVATKAADRARMEARAKNMESARLSKAHRMAFAASARVDAQLQDADGRVQLAETAETRAAALQARDIAAKVAADAEARVGEAANELQAATAEFERLREIAAKAEADRVAAVAASREASANAAPASIFISRKTGKLYVRQQTNPRFEADVVIDRSQEPIGTVVFSALDGPAGTAKVRWTAVTLKSATGETKVETPPRKGKAAVPPVAEAGGTAAAALDRITIPAEVAERLAELIRPGASLIVSDEAMSNETGTGTDFIVQPEGAVQVVAKRTGPRFDRQDRYRAVQAGGGFFSWW